MEKNDKENEEEKSMTAAEATTTTTVAELSEPVHSHSDVGLFSV